ncbi:MAG: hypothetical protein Q9199_006350 [Rusavskia elegans]
MAPASDTALGINEIVSIILSCLPKKHLKSARLINKTWASLGGQMLIGTLYISPREIDMAAFDGITQHPDLSKSVKHLVYDTAQFRKYDSFGEYYNTLERQLDFYEFLHLGSAHTELEDFCSSMNDTGKKTKIGKGWRFHRREVSDSDEESEIGFDDAEFEDHWNDPTFIDGYQRSLLHTSESGNIFRPSWCTRVVRGLKALGSITSVIMKNTWNVIYEADGFDHYERTGTYTLNVSKMSIVLLLTFLFVQPHLVKTGVSVGYWEFVQVLEVLRAANKKPKEFRATSDFPYSGGIPAFAFNPERLRATKHFIEIAKGLKVLELELTCWTFDRKLTGTDLILLEQGVGELDTATTGSEIRQKDCLEVLSLTVPLALWYPEEYPPYELSMIINVNMWVRPNLTTLHLIGFTVESEVLERLLFVNLPRLIDLRLERTVLIGRDWDDMIEELRQILPLKSCKFGINLINSNFETYTPGNRTRFHEESMKAAERYVMEGGVHPSSPYYVPGKNVLGQIAMWKKMRSANEQQG